MQLDSYGNVVDFSNLIEFCAQIAFIASPRRPAIEASLSIWENSDATIAQTRQVLDVTFEKLSQGLEELLQSSQLSVDKVEAAVGKSAGDGTGRVAEALQLCATAYEREAEGWQLLDRTAKSVDKLDRFCVKLRESDQILQEQVMPLQVVQSMIRIQSARLDGEAQDSLLALSSAIEAVCGRLLQSIQRECLLVRQTRLDIANLREVLRKSFRRRREAGPRRKDGAARLEQIREFSAEQNGQRLKLATVSQCIHQAVGGLVQGLQFQDIVGQRLEQIEAGFRELQRMASIDFSVQLAQQKTRFANADGEMRGALGQIGQSLGELQAAEQSMHAELKAVLKDRRRRELRSQLQSAFEAALVLVKQNLQEIDGLDSCLKRIETSSVSIGEEIGSVAIQLRFTALNAQVQASRFGEQTGLDVVVDSLRRVADEIMCCSLGLEGAARRVLAECNQLQESVLPSRQLAAEISTEGEALLPQVIVECARDESEFQDSLLAALSTLEHVAKARIKMERILLAAYRPLHQLSPLMRRVNLVWQQQQSSQTPTLLQLALKLQTAVVPARLGSSRQQQMVKNEMAIFGGRKQK